MSKLNLNLHDIIHIGHRVKTITDDDGGSYTYTTLVLVDKDYNYADIVLHNFGGAIEFINDIDPWNYAMDKQREHAEKTSPDPTPFEEEAYTKWARLNYKPGDTIQSWWHPSVRRECEAMNREIQNELREEV